MARRIPTMFPFLRARTRHGINENIIRVISVASKSTRYVRLEFSLSHIPYLFGVKRVSVSRARDRESESYPYLRPSRLFARILVPTGAFRPREIVFFIITVFLLKERITGHKASRLYFSRVPRSVSLPPLMPSTQRRQWRRRWPTPKKPTRIPRAYQARGSLSAPQTTRYRRADNRLAL